MSVPGARSVTPPSVLPAPVLSASLIPASVMPASVLPVPVRRIVIQYGQLKADPAADIVPRTFILSAKAAPGYAMAKLIIKFINQVAEVVNRDTQTRDRLKVVFLSN